jgi:hypothetical protein
MVTGPNNTCSDRHGHLTYIPFVDQQPCFPALLAAEFDAVERFSSGTFGGGGGDDAAGELTIKAGSKY